MDYKWFLFGFPGRINRAKYCLATLIILCGMIATLLLVAAIGIRLGISTGPLSINIIGISASVQYTYDGAASGLFPRIVTVPATLLFGWCYAAVSIKRLHDRNKSGWWVVPLIAAGFYSQVEDRLGGSYFAALLGFAMFIALVWGLGELCWLKGTHGPNRFGPDPLAPAAPARWDQYGELEFVPYSAGPPPGAHVKRRA